MIRQATIEEIEFYETVLYPFQDQIFELIRDDRFYLSGGTCLSRFYYQHRFSDDLDFFFDGYHHSKEAFEIGVREIINRLGDRYTLEMTVSGEYFKRLIACHNRQPLRIEFIYENYRNMGTREKTGEIVIDTKENLATNKLTAVYDRKTVKDFVDLYFLLKEIAFEKIAEWAKYKVIPLDYEGVVITFSDRRLEGEVLMKRNLSYQEFADFTSHLIQRIFDHAKCAG